MADWKPRTRDELPSGVLVELYFPMRGIEAYRTPARILVTNCPEREWTVYGKEWTHWRLHEKAGLELEPLTTTESGQCEVPGVIYLRRDGESARGETRMPNAAEDPSPQVVRPIRHINSLSEENSSLRNLIEGLEEAMMWAFTHGVAPCDDHDGCLRYRDFLGDAWHEECDGTAYDIQRVIARWIEREEEAIRSEQDEEDEA